MAQKSSTTQQDAPQVGARPSRSSGAPTPAVPAAAPASTGPAATAARSAPPAPKMVTYETISKLAFRKWQERGCPAGTPERDWLEAERELNAR